MPSFQDKTGRPWIIDIHVASAKKVRALTGVDIYKLVDNEFGKLNDLLRDPITLVDVIYVLCQDQADKAQVTDEAFGKSLAGPAVLAAADAFLEAFIDFSQDPRTAAVLRSTKRKSLAAVDQLATEAEQALEWITPEMLVEDAKNPGSLRKRLSEKFGSSPASSASTPAPSASAS